MWQHRLGVVTDAMSIRTSEKRKRLKAEKETKTHVAAVRSRPVEESGFKGASGVFTFGFGGFGQASPQAGQGFGFPPPAQPDSGGFDHKPSFGSFAATMPESPFGAASAGRLLVTSMLCPGLLHRLSTAVAAPRP